MYYERDENGKVNWSEHGVNEIRDLPRKVDHIFRKTIKELANTRVEITITKNINETKEDQDKGQV